jgi:hypothetical protein
MTQPVWDRLRGDCPDIGGSCCFGNGQVCIPGPIKSAPQSRPKRTVVDCATDLEQQIGAISRPSQLLALIHAPVDQEIRCAFGDRRPDPLLSHPSGTVVCEIALAGQSRALPTAEIFGLRLDRRSHVAAVAKLAHCTVPKGDPRLEAAARGKHDSLGLVP